MDNKSIFVIYNSFCLLPFSLSFVSENVISLVSDAASCLSETPSVLLLGFAKTQICREQVCVSLSILVLSCPPWHRLPFNRGQDYSLGKHLDSSTIDWIIVICFTQSGGYA